MRPAAAHTVPDRTPAPGKIPNSCGLCYRNSLIFRENQQIGKNAELKSFPAAGAVLIFLFFLLLLFI
ncbi:MAG: hypothetical protein JWN51_239 [Phycisphaerales bacterium]|nr:hypothetical protein [Phycisphaerales bacterium]